MEMRNPFRYVRGTRRTTEVPAAVELKPRRSISDAIKDVFGKDAYDKVRSPKTQMAVALGQKPVYAGTVSKAVVAKRRAANKRARQARAMHRRAAR